MLCCGINNYRDFKLYIKNVFTIFNTPVTSSHSTRDNVQDTEWENISTPRGQ